MTKRERWMSSISMLVSVLPVVIIALIQSFIDPPFIFLDITTGTEYKLDVDQFNIIGLFCVIPYSIMLVVRLLRGRGLKIRNFTVVAVATFVMDVMYVVAVMFLLFTNLRGHSAKFVFKTIDYASLACSLVCLVFSLLSNFLPELPPNPFFGVKNEKTNSNPDIWRKVNSAAATTLTVLFSLTAIATAYAKGIISIVVLVVAIAVYYLWVMVYSNCVYKKFNANK